MNQREIVPLEQERDFGGMLSATLNIFMHNIGPIMASVLVFLGPVALLKMLASYFFINLGTDLFSLASSLDYMTEDPQFLSSLVLMVGLALVGQIVSYSLVYAILGIYRSRQEGAMSLGAIGQAMLANLGIVVGTWLAMAGLVIAVVLVGTLVVAAAGGLTGFFAVLVGIALFVLLVYVAIPLNLLIPTRIEERSSFAEALRRVFHLADQKWWTMLGLLLVLGIISSTLSYAVSLPMGFMQLGSTFTDATLPSSTYIITGGISTLVGYAASTIPVIGSLVLYFNLVEQKDKNSLRRRIENLGRDSKSSGTDSDPWGDKPYGGGKNLTDDTDLKI